MISYFQFFSCTNSQPPRSTGPGSISNARWILSFQLKKVLRLLGRRLVQHSLPFGRTRRTFVNFSKPCTTMQCSLPTRGSLNSIEDDAQSPKPEEPLQLSLRLDSSKLRPRTLHNILPSQRNSIEQVRTLRQKSNQAVLPSSCMNAKWSDEKQCIMGRRKVRAPFHLVKQFYDDVNPREASTRYNIHDAGYI